MNTGQILDQETGLYYYGARYLDPRTSRWLSGDPAIGEYVPAAGQDTGKLRGIGGVFNTVNLHVYHYAGNNPIRYIDPDGEANWDLIGRGAKNIIRGAGKIGGGLTICKLSGAGAVVSGGAATPVAVIGFVGGGSLIASGWIQASVGIAELVAGFTEETSNPTEIQNSVPSTLNQILAVPIDATITSVTGEPSTAAQETAKVIDTVQDIISPNPAGKVGTAIDMFLSTPDKLE